MLFLQHKFCKEQFLVRCGSYQLGVFSRSTLRILCSFQVSQIMSNVFFSIWLFLESADTQVLQENNWQCPVLNPAPFNHKTTELAIRPRWDHLLGFPLGCLSPQWHQRPSARATHLRWMIRIPARAGSWRRWCGGSPSPSCWTSWTGPDRCRPSVAICPELIQKTFSPYTNF